MGLSWTKVDFVLRNVIYARHVCHIFSLKKLSL